MCRNLFVALMTLFCGCVTISAEETEVPNRLQLQLPVSITLDGWQNSLSEVYQNDSTRKRSKFINFFIPKAKPGIKARKFMDDMTFVGIPIFAAGWIIKSEKNQFQQNSYRANINRNTHLLTEFSTPIDDYTQYFGMVMPVALKLCGVEGRSDWPRLAVNIASSWAIMGILVNGIKYTASEMRPDGSKANSWPSGHTATAFLGATWLHKEYGMTRSPWYSVAGYSVATATGVMRVLNNRHWISDILSGAGIGIFAGELGYAITDLIFKEKGLLRNDIEGINPSPSFFSISMGIGLGSKSLSFTRDDLTDPAYKEFFDESSLDIEFRPATTVDAEGAYFFNKYVGIGGRLRLRAMSAKNWGDLAQVSRSEFVEGFPDDFVKSSEITIVTDHITEFSGNLGLYFNLPLSKRFALGTKLLIGRSITQEMDLDAHVTGNVKEMDYEMTIENGLITNESVHPISSTDRDYDVTWNFLTLGGNRSTTYGTGLSLTYKHKSNFAFKVFADYDYTNKTYTMKYDPYRYVKEGAPMLEKYVVNKGMNLEPYEFSRKKDMHFVTLGGSFAVNF